MFQFLLYSFYDVWIYQINLFMMAHIYSFVFLFLYNVFFLLFVFLFCFFLILFVRFSGHTIVTAEENDLPVWPKACGPTN